jgi:hypothetical protein
MDAATFLCLRIPTDKVFAKKHEQIQVNECCDRQFGPKEVCCPICTCTRTRHRSQIVYHGPFNDENLELPNLDPGGKCSYERGYYTSRRCRRFLEFDCVMISSAEHSWFDHFDIVVGRLDTPGELCDLMPDYKVIVTRLQEFDLERVSRAVFVEFYNYIDDDSLEIVTSLLETRQLRAMDDSLSDSDILHLHGR